MNNLIKEVLTSYLKTNSNVEFGYLYGSYSQNTQTNTSDIDIALYLNDTSLDVKLQIIYELSKTINKSLQSNNYAQKDIDLVVLNEVKNIYLLEKILTDGIVIKDDSKRVDFELKKWHEVLDFKAFMRYIDAA